MKSRLFWKIGLVYLLLLVLVLLAVDTFVVNALRQEYVTAAIAQLKSLSDIAIIRPPVVADEAALKEWTSWMGRSGTRVTVIARDGRVLADTDEDPRQMENHASRPEIAEAFTGGSGQAVRYSATLGHDLVYLATRHQSGNAPIVIRFSVPLHRLDEALTSFRHRLWSVSLLILLISGSASLLFFRTVSGRIQRLKEFSGRVAKGDFRALPADHSRDELADLSRSLGETAGQLDLTIKTLTEERNQSAAILASMAEGVAVIGSQERLTYCNAAFRQAIGGDSSVWQGRPVAEVIPHSDLLALIQKALTGNETVRSELVVGSVPTRSFSAAVAPIHSNGTVAGAVMVLHDITELRRLERARRDFVANVSHEFKTPLTAIQGFTETLLGGALGDSRNNRRFLEIIRDHARRLERLTSDLLKLSQIEAGRLQLDLRPVSVPKVVGLCLETANLEADMRQLVIESKCDADLPPVLADVRSLQEILQNLLANAIRYSTPGGRITINAAAVGGSEVVISVADTGLGIPKLDLDRIFERFYRTDAARSRESGGTGLGLSIVKHLVEAHRGRIEVESELGRGSTFRVFLPQAKKSL